MWLLSWNYLKNVTLKNNNLLLKTHLKKLCAWLKNLCLIPFVKNLIVIQVKKSAGHQPMEFKDSCQNHPLRDKGLVHYSL